MYQNQTLLQGVLSAPTACKVGAEPRRNSRSCGRQKYPPKACTIEPCGNGFLNYAFPPMVMGMPDELLNRKMVEKEFFASAENLCSLYGISFERPDSLTYPKNLASVFHELKQKIGAIDSELTLNFMAWEGRVASLATLKRYDTGMTLFYLPVEPLHRLLQDKARKETAELLLSVCAYLFQIAGVSYHTEDSSYLNYVYTMVEEWSIEPECFDTEQEQEQFLQEVAYMKNASEQLFSKINSPQNLNALKKRCSAYQPLNETETALKNIAERICTLRQNHPDRSIMDSIYHDSFSMEMEEESIISADQYISFFWSSSDCLYDQLMESVNAELNEIGEIDEPLSIQFFDSPQETVNHDLSFEKEFFELLHEISDNLNSFEYEKHHTITG